MISPVVIYETKNVKRPGRPRKEPIGDPKPWAVRIRHAREAKGLTQTALGELIQRKQSTVVEYESGESEPNTAMFQSLSDALGVSAIWLAFGNPGESDPGGALVKGQEQQGLFSWALHRVGGMLADEGFDGDLTYLVALTRKIMKATDPSNNDARAKEILAGAIEAERTELRRGLDDIRKSRI